MPVAPDRGSIQGDIGPALVAEFGLVRAVHKFGQALEGQEDMALGAVLVAQALLLVAHLLGPDVRDDGRDVVAELLHRIHARSPSS